MLTIIILFITGLCTMFASFSSQKSLPKYLGLAGIIAALVCIAMHLSIGIDRQFLEFFYLDKFATIMTILSLILLFFIILNHGEYGTNYDWSVTISLMFFSTCGVVLLFGSLNLLTLFLGIEIMSIPLYVLAATKRNNAYSLEAGLKYFILGSFTSAFLLFGIALIYGTLGAFDLGHIYEMQKTPGYIFPHFFYIGLLFIITSVVFKMALAPFHFWSPDVYDGSPTIVTGFMSTIVKLGSAVTMNYLLVFFFSLQRTQYLIYIIPIISISLLVGSIMGLVQNNVKRLMAYSSVTHMAFVLSAIIVSKDQDLVYFYLTVYTIAGLIVFLILNHLRNGDDIYLDDLNGLAKSQPILAIIFSIAVLSMAGIPLTGGFIAKFLVLSQLFVVNKVIFGLALLSSAIGIGYYLRLINRIYFYEKSIENVAKPNLILIVSTSILALAILIQGLMPAHIIQLIEKIFHLVKPVANS
jgi:NADH-quinone oxidoreductase subunit N